MKRSKTIPPIISCLYISHHIFYLIKEKTLIIVQLSCTTLITLITGLFYFELASFHKDWTHRKTPSTPFPDHIPHTEYRPSPKGSVHCIIMNWTYFRSLCSFSIRFLIFVSKFSMVSEISHVYSI